jgi:hypothetical protein
MNEPAKKYYEPLDQPDLAEASIELNKRLWPRLQRIAITDARAYAQDVLIGIAAMYERAFFGELTGELEQYVVDLLKSDEFHAIYANVDVTDDDTEKTSSQRLLIKAFEHEKYSDHLIAEARDLAQTAIDSIFTSRGGFEFISGRVDVETLKDLFRSKLLGTNGNGKRVALSSFAHLFGRIARANTDIEVEIPEDFDFGQVARIRRGLIALASGLVEEDLTDLPEDLVAFADDLLDGEFGTFEMEFSAALSSSPQPFSDAAVLTYGDEAAKRDIRERFSPHIPVTGRLTKEQRADLAEGIEELRSRNELRTVLCCVVVDPNKRNKGWYITFNPLSTSAESYGKLWDFYPIEFFVDGLDNVTKVRFDKSVRTRDSGRKPLHRSSLFAAEATPYLDELLYNPRSESQHIVFGPARYRSWQPPYEAMPLDEFFTPAQAVVFNGLMLSEEEVIAEIPKSLKEQAVIARRQASAAKGRETRRQRQIERAVMNGSPTTDLGIVVPPPNVVPHTKSRLNQLTFDF